MKNRLTVVDSAKNNAYYITRYPLYVIKFHNFLNFRVGNSLLLDKSIENYTYMSFEHPRNAREWRRLLRGQTLTRRECIQIAGRKNLACRARPSPGAGAVFS